MTEEEKKNLEKDVQTLLAENFANNIKLSLKEVYTQLEINNKAKEQKEFIKTTYRDYISAKLSYTKNCKNIAKTTPIFDILIKNKKLDVENNIVELTKVNAKIIEDCIKDDPDYFPFAQNIFKYYGKTKIENDTDRALFAVLREIDRDNSTNVWRYNQNRQQFYEMLAYIKNPNNGFWHKLAGGDIYLPDLLVENCGTGVRSLASKVCKYLAEWIYEKDNFYINDKFVRHALLFYLDHYKVERKLVDGTEIKTSSTLDKNEFSYENLHYLLEKLRQSAKEKYKDGGLTKNELDHILWYCYKSFNA